MEFARRRFRRFSPADEFADYHIITSFGHLFSGDMRPPTTATCGRRCSTLTPSPASPREHLQPCEPAAPSWRHPHEGGQRRPGSALSGVHGSRSRSGCAPGAEPGTSTRTNILWRRGHGLKQTCAGSPTTDGRHACGPALLIMGLLLAPLAGCDKQGAWGDANSIILVTSTGLWDEIEEDVGHARADDTDGPR